MGAQRLAALLPRSSVVSVPGTGHSVFGSDLTGCSDRALKAFFLSRKVQTGCKQTQGRIRPDGPIPSSIASLTRRRDTIAPSSEISRSSLRPSRSLSATTVPVSVSTTVPYGGSEPVNGVVIMIPVARTSHWIEPS